MPTGFPQACADGSVAIDMLKHCVAILMLFPTLVHADWTSGGAAWQCNKKAGAFGLIATIHTNQPNGGEESRRPGYAQVKIGTSELYCHLPGVRVRMILRVYGALDGYCQGAGGVLIDRLEVNQEVLLKGPIEFNGVCPEDSPTPVEIRVISKRRRPQASFYVALPWRTGHGFGEISCVNPHLADPPIWGRMEAGTSLAFSCC